MLIVKLFILNDALPILLIAYCLVHNGELLHIKMYLSSHLQKRLNVSVTLITAAQHI